MWNTLSLPWQAAVEEAWLAYCAGSYAIGAAITDASGAIVARGRNRRAMTDPETGQLHGTRLAHAEINALLKLDIQTDAMAYTLYTTAEPCPLCAGATRMAQIGKLCYASHDPPAGSAALLNSTPFFRYFPTLITGPQDDDFANVVVALRAERPVRLAATWPIAQLIVDALRAMYPRGVALGERLAASDELRRWCDAGAGAATVVDALAAQL